MSKPEIIKEKEVFNDILIIEKAELHDGSEAYSRLRVKRPEAAAVLVFNTETQKVILTKQFRYAIHDKVKEPIIEIVAGKLDPGENPIEAAIRETEEEIGYRVPAERMKHLVSCFASPGYTSEKFHLYLASVTNPDKINNGGGLEEEKENIEVIEMDLSEFKTLIANRTIEDAKTYIAAAFLM